MPRFLPSRGPLSRGLYLVTPDEPDSARLRARVAPLLPFATWLQYRNKAATATLRTEQAAMLQALCAARGVPLVVNDDPRLAASVGAAGVHLGEDDGAIATARALLGERALVGVSCYDDPRRARTISPSARSFPRPPSPAPATPIPACCAPPRRWACRWWRSAG